MRLLIGTLYSIENEFEECCKAIQAQTYQNFEHFVIQGLPNKDAHDKLFQTFMDQSNQFDIFIKIDADMVIQDKNLFQKIVDQFKNDPILDDYTMTVHDFFTDRWIWGLCSYRNTVKWFQKDEQIFVDKVRDGNSIRKQVMKQVDGSVDAPVTLHCKNPGLFQSFHYGFHRGIKAKVRDEYHWKLLAQDLYQHYYRTKDIRLAMAILGFESAISGNYSPEVISYDNKKLESLFQRKFIELNASELESKIFWARIKRFAMLQYPNDMLVACEMSALKKLYLLIRIIFLPFLRNTIVCTKY